MKYLILFIMFVFNIAAGAAVMTFPTTQRTEGVQPVVESFASYLRTHRTLLNPLKPAYENGVVLVKFKTNVAAIPQGAVTCGVPNVDAKLLSVGAYKISHAFHAATVRAGASTQAIVPDPLSRIYAVNYLSSQDAVDVAEMLALDPNVEYAEPSPIRYTVACSDPNDYDKSDAHEWQLQPMNVRPAWDYLPACDNTNVIMAIVDSGVDIDHDELKNILWTNSEAGSDGYQNDINGVDLVGNVSDAQAQNGIFNPDGDPRPGLFHGTHVAGCADAQVNNGIGICGVSYNCPLMSIKCATDDPNADAIYRGYDGIQWAADHGAGVINCSWGGPGISQAEQDVIDYAFDQKNAVVVAAAGNSSNDNDINAFGPANLTRLLSVGAIEDDAGSNDVIIPAYFSDYGTSVRTWAPGMNIYSTMPNQQYGIEQGTSMASPLAAGVAALVRAVHPDFTADQVVEQVHVNSTVPISGTTRIRYYGMVDAFEAVSNVDSLPGIVVASTNGSTASDTVQLQVTLKNLLPAKSQDLHATLTLANSNSNIVIGSGNTKSYGAIAMNQSKPASFPVYLKNGATRVVGKFLLTLNDGTFTDYLIFTATIQHSGIVAWNFNTASTDELYSVHGISDNLAWAVGGDTVAAGIVYNTLDGATWTQNVTGVGAAAVNKQTYYCVEALLASDQTQRVWLGSNTNAQHKANVFYSTYNDSGFKWNPVPVDSITKFVNTIHFFNPSQGILIGDAVNGNWGIATSIDGGRHWNHLAAPVAAGSDIGWSNCADWINGTGWFGTSSNKIYKSTDSGNTWKSYTAPFASAQGISFSSSTTGLAFFNSSDGTGGSKLARSTDGGLTWGQINGPGTNPRYAGIVYSKGSPTVWICGSEMVGTQISNDFVYISNNNGNSWTSQTIPQSASGSYFPSSMSIGLAPKSGTLPQNLTGWIVGTAIIDYNQQFTVGVHEQPAGAITEQTLQCFPNPFSGRTLLRAALTGSRRAVSLIVYNAIGQAVADLSDQVRQGDPAQVAAMFDASRVSEGIYFALLRLSDGAVSTIKLSVVK